MKMKEKEALAWLIIGTIIDRVPKDDVTVKLVEEIMEEVLDNVKQFPISRD